MKTIMDCLRENPVIAAANRDDHLEKALLSECEVIFLLQGTIITIKDQVARVRAAGKRAFLHIDLIEGFSSREVVVDALVSLCPPDGIISTKPPLLRRAHQLGLCTVQRVFAIDSKSVTNMKSLTNTGKPDFLEILPGVIPRVLRNAADTTGIPVIAGGLIEKKSEVIAALDSGAIAVSTTRADIWRM